eukprot:6178512-Pleurochrysis_carterae.AAC.1
MSPARTSFAERHDREEQSAGKASHKYTSNRETSVASSPSGSAVQPLSSSAGQPACIDAPGHAAQLSSVESCPAHAKRNMNALPVAHDQKAALCTREVDAPESFVALDSLSKRPAALVPEPHPACMQTPRPAVCIALGGRVSHMQHRLSAPPMTTRGIVSAMPAIHVNARFSLMAREHLSQRLPQSLTQRIPSFDA